jgi:hypothetical protein
MAKTNGKRNTEQEKASREAARKFFKDDPSKTANDALAYLKEQKYWTPSDPKAANVWANNQKRAAGGKTTTTTVRKAKPNPVVAMAAAHDIAHTLGGTEKAINVLENIRKIGSIGEAIRLLKKWDEVVKAAKGDAKVAGAVLDALK